MRFRVSGVELVGLPDASFVSMFGLMRLVRYALSWLKGNSSCITEFENGVAVCRDVGGLGLRVEGLGILLVYQSAKMASLYVVMLGARPCARHCSNTLIACSPLFCQSGWRRVCEGACDGECDTGLVRLFDHKSRGPNIARLCRPAAETRKREFHGRENCIMA